MPDGRGTKFRLTACTCHGEEGEELNAKTCLFDAPQEVETIRKQFNKKNKGKSKWISKDGGRIHFCSECGWGLADDPNCESPYIMLSDKNRDNEERGMGQYGWCEWLMNYCPNCGKNMKTTE